MKKTIRSLVSWLLACLLWHTTALAADAPQRIPAGTSITLGATAEGNPDPTFEWFRGTTKIGEGASITIPDFSAANVGSYTAKATNESGSAVSDPLVLIMGTPPTKPVIKITAKNPPSVTVQVQSGMKVITSPK